MAPADSPRSRPYKAQSLRDLFRTIRKELAFIETAALELTRRNGAGGSTRADGYRPAGAEVRLPTIKGAQSSTEAAALANLDGRGLAGPDYVHTACVVVSERLDCVMEDILHMRAAVEDPNIGRASTPTQCVCSTVRGRVVPAERTSTVGGRLTDAVPHCRQCREWIERTGALPTEADIRRHEERGRWQYPKVVSVTATEPENPETAA